MHESLIKEFLIERDPEFKKLYLRHYQYEIELNKLQNLSFRSNAEQLRFKELKKKKLTLKDRMQILIHKHKTLIES